MILSKIDLNEVYNSCDKEAHLKTECSDTSEDSSLDKYQTAVAQQLNSKIQRFSEVTGKIVAKYKLACQRFSQNRRSDKFFKLQSLRNKLAYLKRTMHVQTKLLEQYDREKEMLVKQLSLMKRSDM